jgi:lipopolysaccharide biosynthesis regulator YciM
MARQLYNALQQPQQQDLENAQSQGQINYKQDDQVAAQEQITRLLGKEPPMSLFSRLIKMLNDAVVCERGTT